MAASTLRMCRRSDSLGVLSWTSSHASSRVGWCTSTEGSVMPSPPASTLAGLSVGDSPLPPAGAEPGARRAGPVAIHGGCTPGPHNEALIGRHQEGGAMLRNPPDEVQRLTALAVPAW